MKKVLLMEQQDIKNIIHKLGGPCISTPTFDKDRKFIGHKLQGVGYHIASYEKKIYANSTETRIRLSKAALGLRIYDIINNYCA